MKCEVRGCNADEDSLQEGDFYEVDNDDGWNLCRFHLDLVYSIQFNTFAEIEVSKVSQQAYLHLMIGTLGLRRHTDQELEEGITLRGQRTMQGAC